MILLGGKPFVQSLRDIRHVGGNFHLLNSDNNEIEGFHQNPVSEMKPD